MTFLLNNGGFTAKLKGKAMINIHFARIFVCYILFFSQSIASEYPWGPCPTMVFTAARDTNE